MRFLIFRRNQANCAMAPTIICTAVLLACLVSSVKSQTTSASPVAENEGTANLERWIDWVHVHGKFGGNLTPDVAKALGLDPTGSGWPCKLKALKDPSDKTSHVLYVRADGDGDVEMCFTPADESYRINWRTDATGRLIRTVFVDVWGVRVVPNDKYAEQFEAEKKIWTLMVRAPDYLPPGKWTTPDGATWEFLELKPTEGKADRGEIRQGSTIGHYDFDVPGRLKIEMPSRTSVYQIQVTENGNHLTLTDSSGQKLEFTRAK